METFILLVLGFAIAYLLFRLIQKDTLAPAQPSRPTPLFNSHDVVVVITGPRTVWFTITERVFEASGWMYKLTNSTGQLVGWYHEDELDPFDEPEEEEPEPPAPPQTVNQNCRTLEWNSPDFRVVNQNPCLLGQHTSYADIPDASDNIVRATQDVPPGYERVLVLGDQRTPPFCFHVDPATSTRARGYEWRIDNRNGQFGYALPGLILRAGQRYILKVVFHSDIVEFQPSSIYIGGKLNALKLPDRAFNLSRAGEVIWVVESAADLPVTWRAFLNVTWAAAEGTFTFQGLQVLEAPAGWGDDVVVHL